MIPWEYRVEGLPKFSMNHGSMVFRTSGSTGVVAAWSMYMKFSIRGTSCAFSMPIYYHHLCASCLLPREQESRTGVPGECNMMAVSYTHLRAHETKANLVC